MKQDRQKWNARYVDRSDIDQYPDDFLVKNSYLLHGGRAIELACGMGGNAIYLAQNNYWVDAIDISEHAIRQVQLTARNLTLNMGFIVSDLDYFPVPENLYDLALVFYFFSKNLIPRLRSSVKPGGLIIYCTFNYRHESLKPGFKPEYLVPEGGLAQFFPAMQIIVDEPEAGPSLNLSRLIAKRI